MDSRDAVSPGINNFDGVNKDETRHNKLNPGIESNKIKNLRHEGDQEVLGSHESKDGDRRVSQSTGTSTLGKFNLA
jgi:hypothetical protein